MPKSEISAQVCPPTETLDTLELIRIGALSPAIDNPIRVKLPGSPANSTVDVVDPEGVPITRLDVDRGNEVALDAEPRWLGSLSSRPFEALFLDPAAVRGQTSSDARPVLVDHPIADLDLAPLGAASVLLLVLAGPSVAPTAHTLATLRSATDVAASRARTTVVAVPFSVERGDREPELLRQVVATYTTAVPVRLPSAAAHHRGGPLNGTVLFFTGLSGSGKSTIARAVRNAVLERSSHRVSLLDGDVVRRYLSTGLGFSPAARETNILRIGWVAAELAHHKGLVICSPIAPYAATRDAVRQMVTDRGGRFVLVYVSTPLEECERRDRKGLYARARRGEITEFTGVSAPYEAPAEPDLTLDTSRLTVEEARDRVLQLIDVVPPGSSGSAP